MAHRLQFRRDTRERWLEIDPVLMEGEIGFETDTHNGKVGDGVSTYSELEYQNTIAFESITQILGQSTTLVPSQKLVTDEINLINKTIVNLNANAGISSYPTFSTASAYAVGDAVMYEGKIYEFTTAHPAGDWNISHVVQTSVKDRLNKQILANKDAIATLNANTGISEYPTFSMTSAYATGDVVNYQGRLYRFTADHAAGEWIGTDVEAWSEKKEVNREIEDIEIRLNDGFDFLSSISLKNTYQHLKLVDNVAVLTSGGNQNTGVTDYISVQDIDKIYYNLYSPYSETVIIAAYDTNNNFIVDNSVVVNAGLNEGVWTKGANTNKIKLSVRTDIYTDVQYCRSGQALSIETIREILFTKADKSDVERLDMVDEGMTMEIEEIKGEIQDINTKIGDFKNYETLIGNEFSVLDAVGNISFNSQQEESVNVYSYKKNLLSLSDASFSSSLQDTNIYDGGFSCVSVAGKSYTMLKTSKFLLKAGIYNFHREYSVISGEYTGNIGFVYIYTSETKDGSYRQTSSIASSKTDSVVTLSSDSWVFVEFYANLNGTITSDIYIQFSNLQIEKNDSYTGYESYVGEHKEGISGVLDAFKPINIYSDRDIEILIPTKTISSELARIENKTFSNEIIQDIVCFGDSLTAGTGSSTGKPSNDTNSDVTFPAVLERLINDGRKVINAGIGGESSWMVAIRQGAETLLAEPFTMPSNGEVRIYVKGQEDDYFYTNGEWTYLEDNLSHNIGLSEASQVNPCKIGGIDGTISRILIEEGESDPTTGETVQQNTYAWYFTRSNEGEEVKFVAPIPIVTKAYEELRGHIQVIWCGQNDAPNHGGSYITQPHDYNRVKLMVENLTTDRYIVINHPSGNNETTAKSNQEWNQLFGNHFINIRRYIAQYGVQIANSLGANLEISEDDQELIASGTIPSCLRIDGVHGNYWYYQVVAKAVYDKGKSLGYW